MMFTLRTAVLFLWTMRTIESAVADCPAPLAHLTDSKRCGALLASFTKAGKAPHESCSCYLFCGNDRGTCLDDSETGFDTSAHAAWRYTCHEPLACPGVAEPQSSMVRSRLFVRRMTEDGHNGTREYGWENGTDSIDYSADGVDDPDDLGGHSDGKNSTSKDDTLDGAYSADGTYSADGNSSSTEDDYSDTGNSSSTEDDYGDLGATDSTAFALDAGSASASVATASWTLVGGIVAVAASLAQLAM